MQRDAKLWLRHWQDDWLLARLRRAIWQFYGQTLPTEPSGELHPSQNTTAKIGRRDYFTRLGVIFVLSKASLTVPGAKLRTHGSTGAWWWRNRRPGIARQGGSARTSSIPSDTDAKYWNSHLWKLTIYFLPKPSCSNLSSFIYATQDSPFPHFPQQCNHQGCKVCREELISSSISKQQLQILQDVSQHSPEMFLKALC